MAEYIEREAFRKLLVDRQITVNFFDNVCRHEDGCIIDILDNQLEVSVDDIVPHGRWDNIPNTYVSVASKDGAYSGNATSCSVCQEVNPNAYKTNYCPNCGAKMIHDNPKLIGGAE